MPIIHWELDLNDPSVCYRVDSLGRRRAFNFDPAKHDPRTWGLLGGQPLKRKFPHPAYALGYAWAVSYEYQMLLIECFTRWEWPTTVMDLAAGLVFSTEDSYTESYKGMVAYESAVAQSVKDIRPGLVEALEPFAARHGLNHLPWGLGWLYRSIPQSSTYDIVDVHPELSETKLERRRTDPRTTPALDALLIYLWLTGGWRNLEAQQLLEPVMCFQCDYTESPNCSKLVCWAAGAYRPQGLKLRINRITGALGIHRKRGRPRGSSRWDRDELLSVLWEYVNYGVFQREIAPHF